MVYFFVESDGAAVKRKKTREKFVEVEIGLNKPLYSTGVVSKILNIPLWVLKQLDKEGVVSPPRKKLGTSRLYSKKELKKLQHCWRYMKKNGVKVKGLKIILKMEQERE
jgi:hypothetical protein